MRLSPLGDRAVIVRVGDSIDEATHRRVRAVCARLEEERPEGMLEYVPAYASVTVHFGTMRYERVAARMRELLGDLREEALPPPRQMEIPVEYGGSAGPDLEELARAHDLTAADVVRIHSGGDYLVHMIGFAPGFPYLGGLDERIATPRRPTPRVLVPAGSIGIAEGQTGIYPFDSPGGWRIIGRTSLRLFDAQAEPPSLLRAGDRVRFHDLTGDG